MYWHTLQHAATHCNTLQHAAAHCNSLKHAATRCITLLEWAPQIKKKSEMGRDTEEEGY